jgi:hypothetical protein
VVKILTTEGMARLAASRYEPCAGAALAGASSTATEDEMLRVRYAPSLNLAAQSGFKVVMTNQIARPTVAVWANNSQRRRIVKTSRKVDQTSINRGKLAQYPARMLDITRFRDFCPSGQQTMAVPLVQGFRVGD